MGTKRAIHVVGTGTIGEPLIGLLLNTRQALEIDEITFHKNIPRLKDRAKIRSLMRRGGKLAVDRAKMSEFEKLGMQPTWIRVSDHGRNFHRWASHVIGCAKPSPGEYGLPKLRDFSAPERQKKHRLLPESGNNRYFF